jgi:hypothetical protein
MPRERRKLPATAIAAAQAGETLKAGSYIRLDVRLSASKSEAKGDEAR